MVCMTAPGATELILYLEAVNRWLADLDTLCPAEKE